MNDLDPDLFLDRFHAADVGEREARPVDLDRRCLRAGSDQADRTRPSTTSLVSRRRSLRRSASLAGRADAQALGELAVGDRRVGVDTPVVLPHGLLDLAGIGQQPGIKHKRHGRGVGRLTTLSRITRARSFLPCCRKALASPTLRFRSSGARSSASRYSASASSGRPWREQALGEVPPQRNVLGREPYSLSQGFERAITGHRMLLGTPIDQRSG